MRKRNLLESEPFLYAAFIWILGILMASLLLPDDYQGQERMEEKVEAPIVAVKVIKEPEPVTDDDIPGMDTDKPAMVARYGDVSMTDDERRELAAVVYLEAGNQTAEGQQSVAEVVLNRVISDDFPGTVHDVLHQGEGVAVPQFSTVGGIDSTEPPQAAYDAVDAALYGESILPNEVVYFSRSGENDRVWGKIGGHVFCYGYEW